MIATTALTQLDSENPWPGLESFEENAREFFFGRDREAQELLRHVLDAPITVLFGRSGLGKTSLLRAGLFPLLREENFLPVYVRLEVKSWAPPLSHQLHQSVRDAVRANAPDAMLPSDEESLWEYLHRADLELWNARNYLLTPVIVLDQFEELFTLGERVPDLVRAFMNDLGDLAENRTPAALAARIDHDEAVAAQFHLASHNYKLLITLREDFLPDLEEWQRRIPALGRSRMRLLPLNRDDAFDAVHKPAKDLMTDAVAHRVVGIIAGDDLHRGRDTAEADVDHRGDYLGVSDVDPALLSLFCRELNEERKRHGQHQFDEQLVEDAKDTTLSNYYRSCVRDLPPRVAHFIESELIIGGFRRSYPREDAVPSILTDDELNRLISSRLLRIVDHYRAPSIELTHDVLTPVVREHRNRRRAEEEKAALAARVEQERQAAEELAAEEAERQVAREKEKRSRILRVLLAVTAVLLAVTALIAVLAVAGFHNANAARSQAQARFRSATSVRLVSEALAILDGARPGGDARALQQLLAARSLDPGTDEGALYSAVVKTLTTRKIIETPDAPSNVALSPDGHRIASVDANLIRLRDADTGQPIGQPIRSTQTLTGVVFSPDGHNLAACDASGTVTSWNAETGQPIGQPTGPQHGVTAVAFSPDGRRLAVVDDHMIISLWDVDSGRPLPGLPIKTSDAVTSVGVSLDGRRVATGTEAGTIRLWDVGSGAPIGDPLTGHTDAVTGVAFSFDGHQLASGSVDDTIRLWNADTGQPIGGPLTGHTNVVTGVAFGTDGQLVSSGADHTIRLWDLARGLPLIGHTDVVTSVAFGPDGHRIASGSLDDTIRLWDVIRGTPIGTPLIGHQGGITSVTLSFDGHRIASGGVDGTVRFFDTDTGQPIGPPLTGHTKIVNSVASTPDGRRIVSGSADGTIRLWNADTGQPIGAPLTGHTAPVFSVAFSPDGGWIASGSADGTIRLWDAETREPIGPPLKGHTGVVISVAFSPDGARLASASTDRTIRLWDVHTGQPVGQPLSGSDLGPVESVAFTPDGRQLASGSANNAIRLWDVGTRQQIGDPLRGQRGAIDGLAFSPDGQRLASASADQTIRLWPTLASPNDLCHKLTANMSHGQWQRWVSPSLPYITACPGLPIAPD